MPRCALTAVTIVQQVRMEDPGRGGVWKRSLIINTTQDPTRSLLLLVLIWSKSKMMEKVCTFSVFSAPPAPQPPLPLAPLLRGGGAVKEGSGVAGVIFLRFCKLGLGKVSLFPLVVVYRRHWATYTHWNDIEELSQKLNCEHSCSMHHHVNPLFRLPGEKNPLYKT